MLPESRHNLETKERDLGKGMELWSINKHHDLCSIRKDGKVVSPWHPVGYETRSEWIERVSK